MTVAGGVATLRTERRDVYCNGATRPYASATLASNEKFQFTYGHLEARVNVPAAADGRPANWPAFWTSGRPWPQNGEIDVMEAGELGVGHNFHYFDPQATNPSHDGGLDLMVKPAGTWTGWHTFAADWQPGRIDYYWDGRPVGSKTVGVTSAPMFLLLTYGTSGQNFVAGPTMQVDYVRVWQRA